MISDGLTMKQLLLSEYYSEEKGSGKLRYWMKKINMNIGNYSKY